MISGYAGAIVLFFVAFMVLAGCTNPLDQGGTSGGNATKIVISEVTIIEDKETTITGEQTITGGENNTNVTNKTIPDYKFEPNKTIFVFFINVSIKELPPNGMNERQGEAILIKKGDADILIDAGPRETSTELVNFLKQKGVDDIELFVSTHARPENYGGIEAVLGNIAVEQFMWNNDTGNDLAYAAIVEKAGKKSLRTIEATYLLNMTINGIGIQVINPRNATGRFYMVDNDGIALRISDRAFCLMTTGDIAYGAQAKIADAKDFNPKCAILQIPNYGLGQGTSMIDILLLKVAPETAIITGTYFDPSDERYTIEEKLKVKGIEYYETFNAGKNTTNAVRIVSDGYNYSISIQ